MQWVQTLLLLRKIKEGKIKEREIKERESRVAKGGLIHQSMLVHLRLTHAQGVCRLLQAQADGCSGC